jgi:hypothetical protein
MKWIFFFIAGLLLHAEVCAEELKALMYRTDGRAWRVFLVDAGEDQLTIRLEKGTANTRTPFVDIDRLEIEHPSIDMNQAVQLFNEAKYTQVIDLLEPVVEPAGSYMVVSNNLQEAYLLLTKAYYESGQTSRAAAGAVQMIRSQDSLLKLHGNVLAALCAVSVGEFDVADMLRKKLPDPAALYVQAVKERAQGDPKAAFRTAVQIIANNPNNMKWLPRTELLCAQLYIDIGLLESADAAARQTQVFYKGMNVAEEAAELRKQVKKMKMEKVSEGNAQ